MNEQDKASSVDIEALLAPDLPDPGIVEYQGDKSTTTEEAPVLTTAVSEPVLTTVKRIQERKPCRVKNCEHLAGAKGYCRDHYRRWLNVQRTGF